MNQAYEGARNLLLSCAGVSAGERLLILHEDPALGWYNAETPALVARVARELGATVKLRQTGGPDNRFIETPPGDGTEAIDAGYDCTIFFARIGDQLRFESAGANRRRVMCYVTSLAALASAYGCVEYAAMAAFRDAIDDVLLHASEITVSCPLGSDLRGRVHEPGRDAPADVTVRRFPVGVHVPIDAAAFSGEVKLARYLTPTGSRVYDPAWLRLDTPITAVVAEGRVTSYLGNAADVARVEGHYAQVAGQFALAPDVVHSWHAGIHPGCGFAGRAEDNPDRWSNTVFTSPRFVHFHTCGSAAPGEICWMVLDPTICADGVPLWQGGTLQPERFDRTRQCLQRWPHLRQLIGGGNGPVGLSM